MGEAAGGRRVNDLTYVVWWGLVGAGVVASAVLLAALILTAAGVAP